MTDRELVLETLKRYGKMVAQDVQNRSTEMTGTELNAEQDYIPSFTVACEKMNMVNRPVGFVCKSSAGRVVKLLQVYDSTIYTPHPFCQTRLQGRRSCQRDERQKFHSFQEADLW